MKSITNKLVLLIAFFSVFIIEWYTPIHSDDYRYALLGLSFDAHLHHYLTWSGRIVADYSSTLLLASESRFIFSALTALVAVLFCYIIVKTPTGTLRWRKYDAAIFTLIFVTFWVANPNIGQTVFWLVGSANYLWTNLFVVAWIWNLYRIQIQREERTQFVMLLLGVLAGCSNESAAPFVVGLAALAVVYDFWLNKKLQLNKCLYFISTLFGASVLIFSPGNFIRASGLHAVNWYNKSILERLEIHLSERFFNHLALIWISYVVLALLGIIFVFARKKECRFNKFNLSIIVLMLLVGVGTAFIMMASPSYPDRVMMSTFVFFLLAISFLVRELVNTTNKQVLNGVYVLTAIVCAVFIWSFSLMYAAYTRVYQQDQVRLDVIKSQLMQKKTDFTIPDFHFLKMQNSGGEFGFFHDPAVYGEYFGARTINRKKVNFDYSVLAAGKSVALNDFTTVRYNNDGDLMLVSLRPLEGTLHFNAGGIATEMPMSRWKFAQINNQYWYYTHINKGDVTNVTLAK
ncbi:DUF3329 domain-containing protein [Dryocola clanedunensis]|uniref:DUF3329 domain-containing protein n=1 Tax=Cedecea sulfonylureivorans TaxID=3051154 RepID=UPI001928E278|nr:DUF6056 family protein [Cedecea sulfonylureivorans]